MSTRYVSEYYPGEWLGPVITPEELKSLGPDGALALLRKRLKRRQVDLRNPRWKDPRVFPGAEMQVRSPGTAPYIGAYKVLNHKRWLTDPGFVNCNGEALA